MDNYIRYFNKVTYTPKYFLGDRVRGKFNGIPFVGTVASDSKITDYEDASVNVFLDLPIKHSNQWHTIIQLKHRELKKFS